MSDFELFLKQKGLSCQRRVGPDPKYFGNMLIEYVQENLAIRMTLDRGEWSFEFADNICGPNWYGIDLIHSFLLGLDKGPLDARDSAKFIEDNWGAIVNAFNPEKKRETCQQLENLKMNFRQRIFINFTDAIKELQSFLTGKGLRLVDVNSNSSERHQKLINLFYKDDHVGIRIISDKRFRIELADMGRHAETWYDLRLFRLLLEGRASDAMLPADWFDFTKANWDRFVNLFGPSKTESTHLRLDVLNKEFLIREHNRGHASGLGNRTVLTNSVLEFNFKDLPKSQAKP